MWTRRHAIADDDGQPLRLLLSRLRKTHKALWYRKTEGYMARFARPYGRGRCSALCGYPSLRPLHEGPSPTPSRRQSRRQSPPHERRSCSRPSRRRTGGPRRNTPTASSRRMRSCPCSMATRTSGWRVRRLLRQSLRSTGRALSATLLGLPRLRQCRDHRPQAPGHPRILALIEAEREGLAASDWHAKFGHAHARITNQVLPAFSETVVAEARATRLSPSPLYLPPEART